MMIEANDGSSSSSDRMMADVAATRQGWDDEDDIEEKHDVAATYDDDVKEQEVEKQEKEEEPSSSLLAVTWLPSFRMSSLVSREALWKHISEPGRASVIFEFARLVFYEDVPRLLAEGVTRVTETDSKICRWRLLESAAYADASTFHAEKLTRLTQEKRHREVHLRRAGDDDVKSIWCSRDLSLRAFARRADNILKVLPHVEDDEEATKKKRRRVDLLVRGAVVEYPEDATIEDLHLEESEVVEVREAVKLKFIMAPAAASSGKKTSPSAARRTKKEEEVPVVKRKRGRPRKIPLVGDQLPPPPKPKRIKAVLTPKNRHVEEIGDKGLLPPRGVHGLRPKRTHPDWITQ